MKVQISLDDALMERLDDYAKENYMSRSGLISIACTQYLNSQDVVRAIKEMSFLMRKIAETGTIDKEQIEQLADIERLSKMLTQSK